MSRKRRNQSAARGAKRTGLLSVMSWHKLRRPFWYTFCAAAGIVLVLAGSRAGFWISSRVKVRSLKILMAVVLAIVAAEYLFFK